MEPRLMRTIWRIVRRREAAEDALQDALTVIWRKRAAVARHPNPQALILRIAVSAASPGARRRRCSFTSSRSSPTRTSQVLFDLRGVDGIAAVMAGPVLDKRD